MSRVRQIMVAGSTFTVALGIGFVMQNGDALAARFGTDAPAPTGEVAAGLSAPIAADASAQAPAPVMADAAPVVIDPADVDPGEFAAALATAAARLGHAATVTSAGLAPIVPGRSFGPGMASPAMDDLATALAIPDDMAAPAMPDAPVHLAALETDEPVTDVPMADVPGLRPDASCMAEMTAEAVPAALVALHLSAPCAPDTVATIHHQGMMFTVVTDAAGVAEMLVPALARDAVFIADLSAGNGAAAIITVPEIDDFDRAVLQWQGDSGLQIHALEFGASYGEAGHVWAAAAGDVAAAASGTGGFLMQLGDATAEAPFMAEVYTYPTGNNMRDGTVRLSVEAQVTAANCGREVAAQSLQVSPGMPANALDLTMTMPGCEATGDFLVLSNMLMDLTLAAR